MTPSRTRLVELLPDGAGAGATAPAGAGVRAGGASWDSGAVRREKIRSASCWRRSAQPRISLGAWSRKSPIRSYVLSTSGSSAAPSRPNRASSPTLVTTGSDVVPVVVASRTGDMGFAPRSSALVGVPCCRFQYRFERFAELSADRHIPDRGGRGRGVPGLLGGLSVAGGGGRAARRGVGGGGGGTPRLSPP